MGTKYSSNSASGYNATPPADDGTVSEANKGKWSTIKTKLGDPVKALADAINTDLVTHFDNGPVAYTSNQTLGAANYGQVIQASGSGTTLTLSDAATLGAGWNCEIISTDTSNTVTIDRATASDMVNETTANISLLPLQSIKAVVNAAANGFLVNASIRKDKANTVAEAITFTNANIHSGLESFALTKFSTALGANYLNNAAFSAAVATNALTFTLLGEDLAAPSATNPVQIAFRSATLTTGGSTVRTATAATTVVAPSGATLGFIANEASYVYLYAIDNAGTVELAISGAPQDTSGRVTSTTIGTGSDTKATLYSTTGRTDVACRYLGKILITTGATPGQWGSAATSIHGVNETPPMWSVGYGQTWQDVTGSRAFSTTYTNSTGKPIIVQVEGGPTSTAGSFIQFTVGGVLVNSGSQVYSANAISVGSVLVPVGATYSVTASGTVALSRWVELR